MNLATSALTPYSGQAASGYVDGNRNVASYHFPFGLAFDSVGNLYIADHFNNRIRRVDKQNNNVTTLAGRSTKGFQDGSRAQALFDMPEDVVVDQNGIVYIADTGNHRIRRVDANRNVTTIAGSSLGFSDGIGTQARFNYPRGFALDSSGNLYIADAGNNRIRKLDLSRGLVTTVAGSGATGAINASNPLQAGFNNPNGIAIDAQNNIHITDTSNRLVRKISAAGVVTTLAGETGANVFIRFREGAANFALFNRPMGLAIDALGQIYVADTDNHLIRRIR